jgi:predicted XRE-type DNA-binding protein
MTFYKQDPISRFNKFVSKVDSGCHEWTSTIHRDGYGKFYLDGKQMSAHRAAYMLFVGAIPKGMLVMHTCDNRKCVNPKHLRVGTYSDNFQDMVSKNRHIGRRKLTNDQVLRIIDLLNKGQHSQQEIGDMVGISQITVSRISKGQRRYLSAILNARTDQERN